MPKIVDNRQWDTDTRELGFLTATALADENEPMDRTYRAFIIAHRAEQATGELQKTFGAL